jgi:tRNA-splicing ligase RtcB
MEIKKINDVVWEMPKGTVEGMNVPGRIFASEKLLEKMKTDRTLLQLAGVACLPGIYKYSIVLPDGHSGYGFPIGGVAALDFEEGGISPGGIGYDINCGVRLMKSDLKAEDISGKVMDLIEAMFKNVPAGLGRGGKVKISSVSEFDNVLERGAKWAVENGYGWENDLKHLEEEGMLDAADTSKISEKAKHRGMPQLGSLGAGNHFLEIQRVEKIFNPEAAKAFGLEEGQITVMIHTGSRGLGHQTCSDYLRKMEKSYKHLITKLPDRELVYAPAGSDLAEDYFSAMSAAANFAWCNRQMIVHWVRESFQEVLKQNPEDMGMDIVYDVAHNIAKVEKHMIDGKERKVYVHRKGATRAFGPGRPEIPEDYRSVGQPVLIPGSMGTASYVLVGSEVSMEQTFGSTAHGAGRQMSRTMAKKSFFGKDVADKLKQRGILVRAASWKGVAEEAPKAYKDIDEVARVSDKVGIGKLVARLVPVGVVKG